MNASTAGPEAAAPEAPPATRSAARRARVRLTRARLTSLDAVRGLMLVLSVTTDSVMPMAAWFDHAAWIGVHPLDVVFPTFVTLSGCGLAFAHRRGVGVRRLARRVVELTAAGLAYNAVVDWTYTGQSSWAGLRWTGVLQLYAGVVLVVAGLHLVARTWRVWLAIALALAAAHTALVAAWARTCAGGVLTTGCNPSRTMDSAVLSLAHLYAGGSAGHDPEGVVSLLGACASAAAGAAVGNALLHARDAGGPRAAVGPVVTIALWSGAGAGAASLLVPATKRLWTMPLALSVATCVALVLLGVHAVLDRGRTGRGWRVASWPVIALGRNSLLVYFGSHVVMALLDALPRGGVPLATRAADAVAVVGHPQVCWSAVVLLAWMAVAAVLHRRKIYVRA